MSDWPTAGVDYTVFPNGRVEMSVVKSIDTSEPVSLVDRLEAVRGFLLVERGGYERDNAAHMVRAIDDHLATLDDAIEDLHPVHGEMAEGRMASSSLPALTRHFDIPAD